MNPLLGVCLTNLLYVTQKYVRSLGFHCVQSSTQATISPQEQEAKSGDNRSTTDQHFRNYC